MMSHSLIKAPSLAGLNPPAIEIASLHQARLSVKACAAIGCRPVLISPPAAASFIGVHLWQTMMSELRPDILESGLSFCTNILDCGSFSGYAISAIRHRLDHIVLERNTPLLDSVRLLAEGSRTTVLTERPVSLKLPAFASADDMAAYLRTHMTSDTE